MGLIAVYHTWTDGYIPMGLINSDRLNTNFNTLYTEVNGLLDEANIENPCNVIVLARTYTAGISKYLACTAAGVLEWTSGTIAGGGEWTKDTNNNIYTHNLTSALGTLSLNNFVAGEDAGDVLNGGDNNVIIGTSAAHDGIGIQDNVIIGREAGHSMTQSPSDYNVILGGYAGYYGTTTMTGNVFIGYSAGYGDGEGLTLGATYNVAVGYSALGHLTTGDNNVCIGPQAGHSIKTGSSNICVGSSAGNNFLSGTSNIILGSNSSTITGTNNILIGSGETIAAGTYNICIGSTSNKATIGGGDHNVFIGYSSGCGTGYPSLNRAVAIGYEAYVGSDDQIVLGGAAQNVCVAGTWGSVVAIPFTVFGDNICIRTALTPDASMGTTGQICWDANFIYVATGTHVWKKAALAAL